MLAGLGVLAAHVAHVELAADATTIVDLLDRVLRQRRGVNDARQAALDQACEGDKGVGDNFGDQFLAAVGTLVAEGEASLFDDGRQKR